MKIVVSGSKSEFITYPKYLLPFVAEPRNDIPKGLPFCLTDYIQLVDLTGRQSRDDKRGAIENTEPSILTRIGLDAEHWLEVSTQFESCFKRAAGKLAHLERYSNSLGMQRVSNKGTAIRLFVAMK